MSISKRTCVGAITAIALTVLVGCGGGLLGALLGLIALGGVAGDVTDLFDNGDDPAQFRVLMDGQLLPVTPGATGALTLTGLPEGRHLLQVVNPNRVVGALRIINVDANATVDLGDLTAVHGGRIVGTVRAETPGGGWLPARRVLVVALAGGAAVVDSTHASPVNLPPAATYYAGYTDGNGDFSLDAVEPGDYLITAAVAGHKADAWLVQGLSAGQGISNVILDLAADPEDSVGTVAGLVSGSISGGSQSLPNAALSVAPAQGFTPRVPTEVRDRIAQQSGASLMSARWFTWNRLSALTDAGGSYQLPSPPGSTRLRCFAYGYQAQYQDIQVLDGQTTTASFTLPLL